MKFTSVHFAWLYAGAFYLATAIGFIPNLLLGPGSLFVANTAHNLVHLVTGLGFTIVALWGQRVSTLFMQAFGIIYALTGLVGFLATSHGGEGHLLGIVHINTLDNFLHLGLGAAIGATGWVFRKKTTLGPVSLSATS